MIECFLVDAIGKIFLHVFDLQNLRTPKMASTMRACRRSKADDAIGPCMPEIGHASSLFGHEINQMDHRKKLLLQMPRPQRARQDGSPTY